VLESNGHLTPGRLDAWTPGRDNIGALRLARNEAHWSGELPPSDGQRVRRPVRVEGVKGGSGDGGQRVTGPVSVMMGNDLPAAMRASDADRDAALSDQRAGRDITLLKPGFRGP
jgi:hypothetical protein